VVRAGAQKGSSEDQKLPRCIFGKRGKSSRLEYTDEGFADASSPSAIPQTIQAPRQPRTSQGRIVVSLFVAMVHWLAQKCQRSCLAKNCTEKGNSDKAAHTRVVQGTWQDLSGDAFSGYGQKGKTLVEQVEGTAPHLFQEMQEKIQSEQGPSPATL
jgi:hypothetical protein